MLAYGLGPALNELVDRLSERANERLQFQIDVAQTDVRYDPQVEQHIFRIAQQACENSLRHAQAEAISIHGELEPDKIRLVVKDDGVGFPMSGALDLNRLLLERHYGLVGMFERAAIIGAELSINSGPEPGTRIEVIWKRTD
jgi:signal transduction histidine kinase